MHMLLVGAWPELTTRLIGLRSRVTLLQLPGHATAQDEAWTHRLVDVDYYGNPDAAVETARQLDRVDPFDVVVGFREHALGAVARIAAELAKPCVPGPVESLGRDKAAVRDLLNAGGCREVRHRVCHAVDDLSDFAAQLGTPVIVKPVDGAGSVGVHAVHHPSEADAAWAYTCAAAGSGAKLAEQLIDGPEFSVEVRSTARQHTPVAITEKLTTGPPHFVETGHLVPARICPIDQRAIAAEAVLALNSLGHHTGPSHVEVIMSPDGPRIVEVNRRLGGDRIWELVLLALGRDLMRESLEDAIDSVAPRCSQTTAEIQFRPQAEPHTAQQPPSAMIVRQRVVATDNEIPATVLRSSHDRTGYILTTVPRGD